MDFDGKACNNIPEAVNKVALLARLDHSRETGWNKHDSSYYFKQNSKFFTEYNFSFIIYKYMINYHLQVYDKL